MFLYLSIMTILGVEQLIASLHIFIVTGKVGDTIYEMSNGGGEQKNIKFQFDTKWDDEQYVRYEKRCTRIIYENDESYISTVISTNTNPNSEQSLPF